MIKTLLAILIITALYLPVYADHVGAIDVGDCNNSGVTLYFNWDTVLECIPGCSYSGTPPVLNMGWITPRFIDSMIEQVFINNNGQFMWAIFNTDQDDLDWASSLDMKNVTDQMIEQFDDNLYWDHGAFCTKPFYDTAMPCNGGMMIPPDPVNEYFFRGD